MHSSKGNDENTKEDKKSDDPAIVPGIPGSTPLQCEKHTNDSWQKQEGPDEVEFLEPLFPPNMLAGGILARVGEEEKNEDRRNKAKGEIDIETVVLLSRCDAM